MSRNKLSRRQFVAATALSSAALITAPYVRGAYAAGKLSIGLWDHWVPGANDTSTALVNEWAAKEKVEVSIDYITTQGNKLIITIAAEAQAKSGHDVLAMTSWWPHAQAELLEPMNDIMEPLIKQNGAVNGTVQYLGKAGDKWLGVPATIGIGPLCLAPGHFVENAERARSAAEILQLVELSRPMASFEELGVYTLLFKVDHPQELERFMRRWIGTLIDYDEKRNADLTITLAALLEGRGLRKAAEQLVIHVSTLKYRIKRINAILALDYHDPEIAFNLQLAVRLYKISGGKRGAGQGPGAGGCPPDKGGESRQRSATS